MTVPAGTFTRFRAIGQREDLENMIYDISPTDTVFMSNIDRKGRATSTYHEWQVDALDAATSGNAHIEGDDDTANTATPTTRYGNYAQILKKVPSVSGSLESGDPAGARSMMAYQVAKHAGAMKLDLEKTLCGTQAAVVGTAATARKMAGVGRWLWSNQVKKGAAATTPSISAGAPTAALTAGTAGTFTEANLKSIISSCWTAGGDPSLILTGAFNKQRASSFTGIATQYRDNPKVAQGVIIGAADVYVSDFGTHNIVASRLMPTNNVYALDPAYWGLAYYRQWQNTPLAKTGDNTKRELLCEVTLVARNPSASGKIYTTTTS